MTWEKFWSIIDRVRAQADMQDEASVKQFLYTELIKLPQDELLGFDCAWQSYRNKANFPKMVAAACIINDGSSDDRFTDFRNWLIIQGYDAYRQALIDPDNLAALNIPFRDTEWMGCLTQHRINESAVLTLVSDTLRAIAEYFRNDRTEFIFAM